MVLIMDKFALGEDKSPRCSVYPWQVRVRGRRWLLCPGHRGVSEVAVISYSSTWIHPVFNQYGAPSTKQRSTEAEKQDHDVSPAFLIPREFKFTGQTPRHGGRWRGWLAVPEHTGKNPCLTVCKKLGFRGANRLVHRTKSEV